MLEAVLSYFTSWTNGFIGQSHLFTALLALVSGAWALWANKGTKGHRAVGYVYLASMLFVNGTALVKYDLSGSFNLFHAAAIVSLATIVGAFATVIIYRKTRDRRAIAAHGTFMIWSYFGLFAALVAEVFTRALPFMLHGEGGWTRFSIALAAFMLLTGYLTQLYAKREINRTTGL